MMQGPGWALVLDMCSPEQQKTGNAVVSTLSALGGILTNLLGFINLVAFLPFFTDNAHALLYIGVIVVLVTLIPTLIAGQEKRFVAKKSSETSSVVSRNVSEIKVRKKRFWRGLKFENESPS